MTCVRMHRTPGMLYYLVKEGAMFCPNCKAEYLPGVTVCADCGIPLVESLPEEDVEHRRKEPNFVEAFSTINQGDIALIKSILDDAEVEYLVEGESIGLPVELKVLVPDSKLEAAKEMLKDFDLKNIGLSGNE
jgi:hypothetical protein